MDRALSRRIGGSKNRHESAARRRKTSGRGSCLARSWIGGSPGRRRVSILGVDTNGGRGQDLGAQGQVVGDDPEDLVVVIIRLPNNVLVVLLLPLVLAVVQLAQVLVGDELGLEPRLVERDGMPLLAV